MVVAKKRRYDNSARIAAAEQTRENILRATLELFREIHYDDITFPRVAERAGVSPQTVTLHFRNKDGLVAAAREWWGPQEQSLRACSPDPLEAARVIVARYEELGAATIRALAVADRVPALHDLTTVGRASHRTWVEATFGKQLGSGAVRERRIMALVAAYDVYTWHVLRRALDPEATALAMADLARGVLDRGGKR
ncbi:MAG: TetR/AcrR family transcriptional regulator [Deltaproteobacteria bacterium]|nr:TetR/AcrR family transcriptional regulator [Deltaproteobacteria bacterium]